MSRNTVHERPLRNEMCGRSHLVEAEFVNAGNADLTCVPHERFANPGDQKSKLIEWRNVMNHNLRSKKIANFAGSLTLALCVCALFASSSSAQTTIPFASDTTWNVAVTLASNGLASPLGNAQYVCLSSFAPANCPAGATLYTDLATGWAADLSSIPGAFWIWAPGITGATNNSSLAVYWFSKDIVLSTPPVSGKISIAADDYAEIIVNGQLVGATGSILDASLGMKAQNTLRTFGIGSYLVQGTNHILIRAQNGPNKFAGCGPCTYAQNSAGVVFGGTIKAQ